MPSVTIAPGFGIGYQGLLPDGRPNNAGRLRTFLQNSTTPAPTYTEHTGTVANTNPIILNADGRPPQPIWLDSSLLYKFQLEDAAGNVLSVFDNIEPPGSPASMGGATGPAFLFTASTPGYQRLPSGLLVQWGVTAGIASNTELSVVFPLSFPSQLLTAQCTPVGSGNSATPVAGAIALTSNANMFLYNKSATTEAFHWLAIGY